MEMRKHARTIALIGAFTFGLSIFLCGGASLVCGPILLSQIQHPLLSTTLLIFILAAIGIGIGLPLTWQSIAGLSGRPSSRFALPPLWSGAMLAAYLIAIAGGQAVLSTKLSPAWTLPPFHVAAMALPPILLMGSAAALANEPQFTWRKWWSGLGSSFASLALAFLVEMLLIVLIIIILTSVVMVTPDLAQELSRWRFAPGIAPDPAALRALLRNPVVIAMLLIGLALVVPLIEEIAKSLMPGLVGLWWRPSVAGIFLWGVASGAGFAIIEGILNGAAGLEEWTAVALLRIGSSSMHCLTAGLAGWGWGQAWVQRKWSYVLLAYALAVAIHGMWNALSVEMALAGGALEGTLQTVAVAVIIGLLVLLTLFAIIVLMLLASYLSRKPHEGGAT